MDRKQYQKEYKYSWKELIEDMRKLSSAIKKIFKPDVVVVVAKGGWVPARILSNFIKADYYSIGCKSYDDDGCKKKTFRIYQNIAPTIIKNKKVLLLDEVSESGDTLKRLKYKIIQMNPEVVYTAVIHQKETSQFKTDFFAKRANGWIVYPWDQV